MKLFNIFILTFVSSFVTMGCSEQTDYAEQKATQIDPDNKGVEEKVFSNKYASALKISLEPGQQLPWHKGEPRVIYSLSDYSVRFKVDPSDTSSEKNYLNAGDVHWHEENVHSVENTGNSTADYIVIERLARPLPDMNDTSSASDIEVAAPKGTTSLLDNRHVKVVRVELMPGEETPMHSATARLIYSLTNYAISFNTAERKAEESEFAKGDMHWHSGGKHAVHNTGDSTARFVVFEFKQ